MAEKRKFTITFSSSEIETLEYQVNELDATYLTKLTGWDDTDAVQLETAPKLVGAGSYLISKRIAERQIVSSLNIFQPVDIKNFLIVIKADMLSIADITLSRTYLEDDIEVRKEVLTGIISSLSWDRLNQDSDMDITFKILNPVKTVYLDGSTTPETGGAL